MPCRNCPNFLRKAADTIDEVRRDRPDLLPAAHDYDVVQLALEALIISVIDELKRQGRWREVL
jgi:hypothetical protein